MIDTIAIEPGLSLDDYASYAHLAGTVSELKMEARALLPELRGRRICMVNSTAKGGGVAEMLPHMIGILRELGLDVRWLVIGTDESRFFELTKRLHNMIHGEGEARLSADDRALYEKVSRELALELGPHLGPNDLLVVHDPQPLAVGALVKQRVGLQAVWRCHIGLDEETPETRAAWDLLAPYVEVYDHCIFSAAEYIPPALASHVSVIAPAIDPLSTKNCPLTPTALAGVLVNSGLMLEQQPTLRPPFERMAERWLPDGRFGPLELDPGILPRPIITQISRWDRLKGWSALLDGFVKLKRRYSSVGGLSPLEKRRLRIARLVLAGPEPSAVQDDPEAAGVLSEMCRTYLDLEPDIQEDVILLSLPMSSLLQNALMVNALQQCSSIVVQNSLREGFGLTVTEAMWKRVAVLGSSACGIRQQIRDGIDGRINPEPENPVAIADMLLDLLSDKAGRDLLARSGQRRVHDEFLVFAQLRHWLRVLTTVVGRASPASSRRPGRLTF